MFGTSFKTADVVFIVVAIIIVPMIYGYARGAIASR